MSNKIDVNEFLDSKDSVIGNSDIMKALEDIDFDLSKVDIDSPDSGYDGVNIVRKGDLITYTMSSEDMLMITKFQLQDGKAELITTQTYESFLAE